MAPVGHSCLHLAAIAMACSTYIGAILFSTGALQHMLGFSMNATTARGALVDSYYIAKYDMDVKPADWTMYISAFIYVWQGVWLVYGVSMTCRRTEAGYLYTAYPVIPPILYVVFSFCLACNVSWLLILEKQYLEVALVFINLAACTMFICLSTSLRRLNEIGHMMVRDNLDCEIWMVRVFVQNGLAMYAAWCAMASIFNFAVVLNVCTGAGMMVGGLVSLTVFTMEILALWILDNFMYERLFRYLITPYIVILISIIGIISDHWNPSSTNAIYTLTLLLLTILLTSIKVILAVYKHRRYPIFGTKPDDCYSLEDRSLVNTMQRS